MWSLMSRKLKARIDSPQSVGFFSEKEAKAKGMRLAQGTAGNLKQGQIVTMYLLVDEEDGVIADAKFQSLGDTLLIAAADIACELLLRKNYDQARRISAQLIEKKVEEGALGFPKEAASLLNFVIDAIDEAAQTCMDIPISDGYLTSPIEQGMKGESQGYAGWEKLSIQNKISVIKEVIQREVLPYVELDAGGVEVLDLKNEREVIIAYKGSCTSCYSATGSTLNAIQQLLRQHVHPDLVVIPDLSVLDQTHVSSS